MTGVRRPLALNRPLEDIELDHFRAKIGADAEEVGQPAISVVLDPGDDYATVQTVLDQHAPADGRIVVHPTPAATSLSLLACDLLAAMGKEPPKGWERKNTVSDQWAEVTAWIVGFRIEEIILLRAHLADRVRLARMAALAGDSGAALTLIWHAPAPDEWASILPAATLTVLDTIQDSVERARADRPALQPRRPQPLYCPPATAGEPGHALSAALAAPLPALSAANLTRFRARLHEQLAADQFATADALYTSGMDSACAYLTEQRAYDARQLRAAQADQPLKDWLPRAWTATASLRSYLLGLTAVSPSPAHTTALIRGAQAGFLRHGLLLLVPDDLGRHRGPGYFDHPLTPHIAATIRARITHPTRAAALVLVLATGMHPRALEYINVRDLADNCSTLTIRHLGLDAGRDEEGDAAVLAIPLFVRDLLLAARAYALATERRGWNHLLLGGFGTHDWLLYDTAQVCGLALQRTERWPSTRYWHLQSTAQWVADPVHSNVHLSPGRQVGLHAPHP